MAKYSNEFKEQTVRKMMPPNAMSVAQVSRETGVSEQTLYHWRNRFRNQGKAVPADPSNPEHWLADYCRRKGLYIEQVTRWREAAIAGAETQRPVSAAERRELQQERKKTRKLEKELRRKEKALAETAALLVLQKKAQAIWGDGEDD